ncbi:hypothetical protein [Jannaschia aquimarina]|uniref:Uncharacterized protein n=1 Tax=Jannaschia aquimarina TaxID=935700 RepID=A0A0D1EFW8_9RHOB|nr:hypothetical protein [Jannaschia aquimarina]KIT16584.1 hypothetical protein jaqu_16790 [Jannaschia aquimarina]SNT41514.1 hypothetical protein SAMN05421775_11714 [Jannaschia aquimarina]
MPSIKTSAMAVAFASSFATAAPAYPIDCAILLCLAGGWPASTECTAARAEFVRRITPWPIEPPLQMWRCPLRASVEGHAEAPPTLLDAMARIDPRRITRDLALDLVQRSIPERADIDLSTPAFDFVRSIRVYDIDWHVWDHENAAGDHSCRVRRERVRIGSYGPQGEFAWRAAGVTEATAQTWIGFDTRARESCSHEGRFRGVAVEWRDVEGRHGFEVVTY